MKNVLIQVLNMMLFLHDSLRSVNKRAVVQYYISLSEYIQLPTCNMALHSIHAALTLARPHSSHAALSWYCGRTLPTPYSFMWQHPPSMPRLCYVTAPHPCRTHVIVAVLTLLWPRSIHALLTILWQDSIHVLHSRYWTKRVAYPEYGQSTSYYYCKQRPLQGVPWRERGGTNG